MRIDSSPACPGRSPVRALGSVVASGPLFGQEPHLQKRLKRAEFRENILREDLAAQDIIDFDEIESALDDDATLEDLRDLKESRREQEEDWAALGIFLLLLSGADAYVSAHLQDFRDAGSPGGGRPRSRIPHQGGSRLRCRGVWAANPRPITRPPARPTPGGNVWESNPPTRVLAGRTVFYAFMSTIVLLAYGDPPRPQCCVRRYRFSLVTAQSWHNRS